ncbi:MAG: Kae1-associated serine/threonine protein kinase [Nanoarchaeota archaeon]|nr:Kae1-associated serine/threonine protein kinase [Nanoarchaeota archaeon]
MGLIAQGAEAKIYLDTDRIVKERFAKGYRIAELDQKLRKTRTRREAKVLSRLPPGVKGTELFLMDDKNMKIEMELLKGKKVRDVLDDNLNLAKEIGKKVALLHNSHIIHGDLTTSNMIFNGKEIYLIDFGLSFFSHKLEDKAVDLHLLRQALESKHYRVYEKAYKFVLNNYGKYADDATEVIERLSNVESRGRNKGKN